MDDALFDRWLYESESDSLDFKRDQYKFINVSDEEKSKLLKDILAMANSWRRVDGYIVIGIEDRPEKPNIVHGIIDHIDDAVIQQFVNNKIPGTCIFNYATYTKENKTIGIIRVPVQERPVFLGKDYGRLKANIIYVRRGSSTDIAKPDEISKMGLSNIDIAYPLLEVGFYDFPKNQIIGDKLNLETTYIIILDEIPEYSESVNYMMPTVGQNSNYYRDCVDYLNFISSYAPINFAVRNSGDLEAVNLRFELEIYSDDIEILLDGDEPGEPDSTFLGSIKPINSQASKYRFEKYECTLKVYNTLDRLHAQRTLAFNGKVYLLVKESCRLKAKATLFFDGQSRPYEKELEINVNCNVISFSWDEFYEKTFKKK